MGGRKRERERERERERRVGERERGGREGGREGGWERWREDGSNCQYFEDINIIFVQLFKHSLTHGYSCLRRSCITEAKAEV